MKKVLLIIALAGLLIPSAGFADGWKRHGRHHDDQQHGRSYRHHRHGYPYYYYSYRYPSSHGSYQYGYNWYPYQQPYGWGNTYQYVVYPYYVVYMRENCVHEHDYDD